MQWNQFASKAASIGFSIFGAMILPGCSLFNESRLGYYHSYGGAFDGGGPTVSPDGNLVAYASPRTGNGDIYRINLDGTNSTRLTSTPDFDCDPQYSPDGLSIAFVREIRGQPDIWIMKSDGTDQRRLTKSAGEKGRPRFTSNQTIVYWHDDPALKFDFIKSHREIWMVDIKTGVKTRITNNKVPDGLQDVSPDGKYISLIRPGWDICLLDRITSEEKSAGDGAAGGFSPDSKQLVVQAGQFGRQIDVMNIDGSERRTVYSKDTRVEHPAFLPDGKAVLFLEEGKERGVGSVLLVNLKDLSVRTIVDTK